MFVNGCGGLIGSILWHADVSTCVKHLAFCMNYILIRKYDYQKLNETNLTNGVKITLPAVYLLTTLVDTHVLVRHHSSVIDRFLHWA